MKPKITSEQLAETALIEIVEKYYNLPILCRRYISSLIDFAIFLPILYIPMFLLDYAAYIIFLKIYFLLIFTYFWAAEWRWGRTLGKLIMGIVVVNKYGEHPNIYQALVRNTLRIFEANPFFGIVSIGMHIAGILIFMTKRKQRAGDMLAGTYVVLLKDLKLL
jgi:uncharacterized RDD family membrane protein YckC